jgi:hypothetical protein
MRTVLKFDLPVVYSRTGSQFLWVPFEPVPVWAGIPHPWRRDGILAGAGVGQLKIPRGTPVSITKGKHQGQH